MSEVKLKPCPFCGGISLVEYTSYDDRDLEKRDFSKPKGHSIKCNDCIHKFGFTYSSNDIAREQWNTRPAELVPLDDKLEKANEIFIKQLPSILCDVERGKLEPASAGKIILKYFNVMQKYLSRFTTPAASVPSLKEITEAVYEADAEWHQDYTNPEAINRIDYVSIAIHALLTQGKEEK